MMISSKLEKYLPICNSRQELHYLLYKEVLKIAKNQNHNIKIVLSGYSPTIPTFWSTSSDYSKIQKIEILDFVCEDCNYFFSADIGETYFSIFQGDDCFNCMKSRK